MGWVVGALFAIASANVGNVVVVLPREERKCKWVIYILVCAVVLEGQPLWRGGRGRGVDDGWREPRVVEIEI